MAIWTNPDGMEVRFGTDQGNRAGKAGVTTGSGKRRELVLTVDLVALGANGTGFTTDPGNTGANTAFANTDVGRTSGTGTNTAIPINARIISANFIQTVAPVGGTSWSLGAFKADGTVVDVAGFLTTAQAPGALIGTQTTAAVGPLFAAAKATGTYTAGKIKCIIEYETL